MKTTEHTASARLAHQAALEALASPDTLSRLSKGKTPPGLALWRKLRKLEMEAHAAATAQCNGAPYGGQPYRLDYDPKTGKWSDDSELTRYGADLLARVQAVFGQPVPGLFWNQDPRGYALKVSFPLGACPAGMVTDWGGYGCLAAEIR